MKNMIRIIVLTLSTSSFAQIHGNARTEDTEPVNMEKMLELQARFKKARMPKYKDLHLDEYWTCRKYHYFKDETLNPRMVYKQFNDGSINEAKYVNGALLKRRDDLIVGRDTPGLIDIRFLGGKLISETAISRTYEHYQFESQYDPKFRVEFYTECSLASQ